MTEIIATIPVSSLRRTPPGYSPPLWRWVLLPASVLLHRYYGGVWFSGDVQLTSDELRFMPGKLSAGRRRDAVAWTIPLHEISEVSHHQGMAMDTIDIHHPGGVQTFKSVRSAAFLERLREEIPPAAG